MGFENTDGIQIIHWVVCGLGTISCLPMFMDSHSAFVKLLLCYAQCLSYLFCTMFPFLNILQHYIEFNTLTIVSLEKSLDVKSFNGYINHLICCHHVSCFFGWTWLPLCSSNCCPFILRMLGTDCSCTCHSFPIR